jgi:hypothetical protein
MGGQMCRALAGCLRKPVPELRVGVGAGVADEVGEELVDAEAVCERTGGGPPASLVGGVVAAGWVFVAGCGDDFGAELVDDPVVWIGAAVGALGVGTARSAGAGRGSGAGAGRCPGRGTGRWRSGTW